MTHGHTHLSREEIAKIEIGHTETTPAICRFLTVLFVIVLVSIPLLQNVVEFREIARERARSREDGEKPARTWPQCFDIVRLVPTPTELLGAARAGSLRGVFGRLNEINNRILRGIAAYERDLKDCSNLVQWLIPRMQVAVTGWLRGGNEDAYCGRDGWLFYRRDVDYLVGPGFLDPKVLARRAASGNEWKAPPQPDPVKAIVDFRDQLAKRDIQLVVVPTPLKPMIYPERYTRRRVDCRRPLQNASYEEFLASLRAADIAVFDPAPLLAKAKAQAAAPLYLETDTHWTPQGMQLAAEELARFVRNSMPLPDAPAPPYATTRAAATNLGDIAVMLRLPSSQTFYRLQSVALSQVTDRTRFWRPDSAADVLLLGDSFANIFSMERMGWGEAAGLPEHLSLALGRPLDALLQNDEGSWKTRGMLATEMKRGNDRLAGKRLVIWQFAARELAFGDWKLIPLELGEKQPTSFFTAAVGESVLVRGVVKAVAPAPRPGSVPYKDHIVMVHLTDMDGPGDARGREAVVLMWSMRDNVWTRAARYRSGEQVRLRVRPWSEVSDKLDAINRAEVDDPDLMRQEPNWGEETERKGREGNVKMSIRRHQRVKWSKKALYLAASLLAVTAVVTTAVRGIAQEAPKVSAFQTECAAKAEAADKANAMAVEGKDGWFFLARELRHLSVGKFWGEDAAKVSRADKPEWADSLPVILKFKEQLDKAGIRLLFVPVPPKAIVYPDMLGTAAATAAAVLRLDPHHQEFYRLLREKGVAVLDLTDDLIQARANETAETRGYCRTDTHWSPGACELAARRIRETAGDALGAPPADNPFHAETRTLNVVGDLERSMRSDEAKGEPLRARVVSSAGEVAAGATEDKGSPVLLMGDSHCLVFHVGGDMLATGAGLADQLAYELRRPVDLLGVRGSGATPARINLMRRAAADTNYLAGKKLVVWCFSAREFTESSGWRQVPIVK